MDLGTIIGVLGASIIVVAWGIAVKLPPPPWQLSMLYGLGSLMLTIYAAVQHDPVFTVLNLLAFIFAVLNLARVQVFRGSGRAGEGAKLAGAPGGGSVETKG